MKIEGEVECNRFCSLGGESNERICWCASRFLDMMNTFFSCI